MYQALTVSHKAMFLNRVIKYSYQTIHVLLVITEHL